MITVEVRLFSILRHRPDGAVRGRLALELADGATVADVLSKLDVPDLPMVISVNDEQAGPLTALHDGDEIELIPAVAGGSAPPPPSISLLPLARSRHSWRQADGNGWHYLTYAAEAGRELSRGHWDR